MPPSVHLSVCLFISLSPLKGVCVCGGGGGNLTKLATPLLNMVSVCESNIIMPPTSKKLDGHIASTRVMQKVLSLIGFLRFIPGIF